jgi:para-nitrobenzyl esterase
MIFTSCADEFTIKANDDPYFKSDFNMDEYEFATTYGSFLYSCFNAEQNANFFRDCYLSRIFWGRNPNIVGEIASKFIGAAHGIDLLLMLNQEPASIMFQKENKQIREVIGEVIREYLTNFIKTGNPNDSSHVHWNIFSQNHQILLIDGNETSSIISMSSNLINEQDVIQKMLNDKSIQTYQKDFIVKNILNARFFSQKLDETWKNQPSNSNI